MVRIKQDKKLLTAAQKKEILQLEKELDILYDQLAFDPGNEKLNREVRTLELKIVRITGEKTIDY
ncbi:hypothetical protein [Parabacteroides sp. AF17-28]|jgi:hypothetical protein|uniref:hypothetical protein n=1 Tax=Parabacteroides sp. AF17-28 TaxID=2292241 RepID=UPI000F00AF0C|nr:hypothetical protein [Parabacteroides sp. AF17-28]RHR56617.1 hypothetical protein DWW90_12585 [Parabacteroides sp. AF17-28]